MVPSNHSSPLRSRFSTLITCLFLSTWIASQASADIYSRKKTLDLSSIESNVADRLISKHIPGAALVIVKDGRLIDLKCFGYRDFARMLPVTPLTPFCIGSCTKGFTAMAAEMAVDAGVLSLSDNPSKYLPEFKLRDPEFNERVTLRDFLSQRTGLEESVALDWNDTSPKKMLHVISGQRPEKRIKNSIPNYCVAGWAIAAATGTTYDKLISDSIFRPLAMNDSRLESAIKLAEDARGHILDKHAQPMKFERELDAIFLPNSGIISSPRDMAKWLGLLTSDGVFEGKRLVSQRGFNEMLTPLFDTNQDFTNKLGWDGGALVGYRVVKHSGGAPGYCASVTLLPDQHIGVVLLTNLGPSSAEVENALPSWILSQFVAAG